MTSNPPSLASIQAWSARFRSFGVERLSIEVTQRCTKGCWFCYNHSHPHGQTGWDVESLLSFLEECAAHGTKAVSFGGGEPLQFEGLEEILLALQGRLFRSFTTHGLLLQGPKWASLLRAKPDKIHISIHFPEQKDEVDRVIRQVSEIHSAGIPAGINLLVQRSLLAQAKAASEAIQAAGIGLDRIVFLPMRHQDTPTPKEMAYVAGSPAFQSVSCLTACGPSPRFLSIGWDRSVAFCSYTTERRPLPSPSWDGLCRAIDDLSLRFCGGSP